MCQYYELLHLYFAHSMYNLEINYYYKCTCTTTAVDVADEVVQLVVEEGEEEEEEQEEEEGKAAECFNSQSLL